MSSRQQNAIRQIREIVLMNLQSIPQETLSEASKLIALYAVCGFANLSSVGIQISGIGAMCPERRPDLIALGFRALLAATLASCMCGSIVGIVSRVL